jgi:tetratricopeptide (TPR) repeat protein
MKWQGYTPHACSTKEQERIESLLQALWDRFPNLVVRAAAGTKLCILRVSRLTRTARCHGSYDSDAISMPSALLLSDKFFDETQERQAEILTHEFVHNADFACQLSYSKEWSNFAGTQIKASRLRKFLSNRAYSGRDYQYENLEECLAESFVQCAVEQNWSSPVLQTVQSRPTKDSVLFLDHFKEGVRKYWNAKYDEALKHFDMAISLDCNATMCYAYKAVCFERRGEFAESNENSAKCLRLFGRARIDATEPGKLFALQVKVAREMDCQEWRKAQLTLSEILCCNPNDVIALRKQAECCKKQQLWFESAFDLYMIKHHVNDDVAPITPGEGFATEFAAISKQIDDSTSTPSLRLIFNRCSMLLCALKQDCLSTTEETSYCKTALSDADRLATEFGQSDLEWRMIQPWLCIKLRDQALAERKIRAFDLDYPNGLETNIAKLVLLQQTNPALAAEMYKMVCLRLGE